MDNLRIRKLIIIAAVVFAALLLPVALLVFGVRGMWKERAEQRASQAQFSEALRQSLEKTADVVLPAPTLGEGAMVVALPLEKFENELQRVLRLAAGVGGTASSWNDGETVRVVANVPSSAEVLFRRGVRHHGHGRGSPPTGCPKKEGQKVEVAALRPQGFRFPVTP
jgi:hypothetical protein